MSPAEESDRDGDAPRRARFRANRSISERISATLGAGRSTQHRTALRLHPSQCTLGSGTLHDPGTRIDDGSDRSAVVCLFWPYAFMQTPAGWIVDRFGVRRVYAVGYVLGSFATAATGLARGTASLIVLRMILGVGQSAVFPASSRATANWFHERERGLVTALYLAATDLGRR